MIQYPLLTAITWTNRFLYGFICLSQSTLLCHIASVYWGLRASVCLHSSREVPSISIRIRSRLGFRKIVIVFFFGNSVHKQMASHLSLEYFGIQRSTWCPSPVSAKQAMRCTVVFLLYCPEFELTEICKLWHVTLVFFFKIICSSCK